jgi:hypothetical protein
LVTGVAASIGICVSVGVFSEGFVASFALASEAKSNALSISFLVCPTGSKLVAALE